MKKLLLSVGVVLLCSARAWGYDFMVDGIAYNKLSETTVEVTFTGKDYNSGKDYAAEAYVIPAEVTNDGVSYAVTKIGDSAFYGSPTQSVFLPGSITEIDNYAFGMCRSLKEINLPSGITSIPDYAFPLGNSFALEKLTIDCDPANISAKMFNRAGQMPALKHLVLGSSLTGLGEGAVGYWANGVDTLTVASGDGVLKCDLEAFERWTMGCLIVDRQVEMTIPESAYIEEIHMGSLEPFATITFTDRCYTDAKLYVDGTLIAAYKEAAPWSNFAEILAELGTEVADQTYGFNVTVDASTGCAEIIAQERDLTPYSGDIVIPETVVVGGSTYKVTSVGNSAFAGTEITSVKLGANVRELKQGAFQSCTLLQIVELNDGLETIGYDVFGATKALRDITIPGTVRSLPSAVFDGSGLRAVELQSGVEVIKEAFTNCTELAMVTLPNTIVELCGSFEGCTSLTDIELPTSLRTIGWFTFANTGITALVIPEGVTELDMQSLGCMNGAHNKDYQLKSLVLPASLRKADAMCLNNRYGLTELVIAAGSDPLITTAGFLNTPAGAVPLVSLTLNRTFIDALGNDITSSVLNTKVSLENVTFGQDLKTVPDLSACSAIRSITVLNAEVPQAVAFHADAYANAVVHVPAGTSALFRAHEVWGKFSNIEEEAAVSGIDASKVRYTIGEGEHTYAFVLVFNNEKRLDNLVLGISADNAALTASEALAIAAQNDDRLKVEIDSDGNISSIAFDLDGNGEFDERDVYAEGTWNVGAPLLASDAATKVLSICHDATTAIAAPYYFYLPRPDEMGVWLPEAMTVRLSDEGCVLPVLVQTQDASISNTTNWQASSKTESYSLDRTIIVTPYTLLDESYHARPTFTGKTGTTYVRYRPRIGSAYVESNYMTLIVEAPEVPMSAIHLAETEVTSGLNKTVDMEFTYEPANATYTAWTATVSDNSIASYSASAGLKTKTAEGNTTVTISSLYDSEVSAEMTLNAVLLNPVTNVHFGHGTEDGVINVNVKQLIGLKPIVEPADADIPEVTITLTDNGTSKEDMTCSTYRVNWWDVNNVRSQFYELSGHRPTGEHPAKVHVASNDGKYERDFIVNVLESDRTPLEGGYEDGTIILNEEWFGHTNGGLNYVTDNKDVIYQAYERENPGMSFGCTSQYGAIWNGKLFVVSKQPADGGDVLPGGGCLVIADAKTLKRVGGSYNRPTYNGMTGDGRAVAGATPNKIYVTTSNGIFIYDITDVENPVITGRIGQNNDGNLYSGQTGDIINGGRYVYAVMQGGGLMCIDPLTDEVTPITDPNIQGVTQTADGKVWYVTAVGSGSEAHSVFVALDPETLEEVERVHMPASIGMVQCSWGAWRSTPFKADSKTGDIWFVTGAAGIMGGASGDYYRFTPGTNPEEMSAFFSLNGVTGVNDFGEEVAQMTYGTPVFDARNNELIVMTGRKGAASGGYRDHWLHFVNGDTHEITSTIKLNAYYWFQSLPIFPDKYDAQFDMEDITMDVADGELIMDLTDKVTDADNINANICLSLVENFDTEDIAGNCSEASVEEDGNGAEDGNVNAIAAEVALTGKTLTVKPLAAGVRYITLVAQSNGREISHTIALTVSDTATGISNDISASGTVTFNGQRLTIRGLAGHTFCIYAPSGMLLTKFDVDSDHYVYDFGTHSGVFIVKDNQGISTKVTIVE